MPITEAFGGLDVSGVTGLEVDRLADRQDKARRLRAVCFEGHAHGRALADRVHRASRNRQRLPGSGIGKGIGRFEPRRVCRRLISIGYAAMASVWPLNVIEDNHDHNRMPKVQDVIRPEKGQYEILQRSLCKECDPQGSLSGNQKAQ